MKGHLKEDAYNDRANAKGWLLPLLHFTWTAVPWCRKHPLSPLGWASKESEPAPPVRAGGWPLHTSQMSPQSMKTKRYFWSCLVT